jgi:cation-transporting ATPase E
MQNLVESVSQVSDTGLSAEQVAERIALGKTNDVLSRTSRSIQDIVRVNVLTRINAILGVLLVVALAAGSPIDALFGFVILANSSIGIIQELRAKRTLDRLAVLNLTRPIVRRGGVAAPIDPRDVVVDDLIEIGPGDQLIVDGVLVEGTAVEVNESLLTGEAEPVKRRVGSLLMSGSFVVAGTGAYRATRVGRDSYSALLVEDAKKFVLTRSELRAGIDRILGIVTMLIIPAGALIIYSQLFASGQPMKAALIGMVAALVPMVPEGLVLMTSIALALGVIRLGRMECLVQDLAAIEAVARVDVVCIDKTGTLTEPGMTVVDIVPCDGVDLPAAKSALASIVAADPRPNATLEAIGAGVGSRPFPASHTSRVPFSSTRKWQGMDLEGAGCWILGAPDVLLEPSSDVAKRADGIAATGLRVLLLARSESLPEGDIAVKPITPQLLIVLNQKLRPDARATLDYFEAQGVEVKVLSGDNVASVQAVARELHFAGFASACDARSLPGDPVELGAAVENASIFGRVLPEQKRAIVAALRARGHTVAMMGDGVNDVLALKLADVGVAMGSGSPATRAVAQIVLLGNSFAALPRVVAEGRRVIGNVERISNLFLSKTVYSALLALSFGLWGVAASLLNDQPVPFLFLPRHIMISAWFTIGIPAFILSLAPTSERARPGFVSRVLRLAIPSGLVVTVATVASYLATSESYGFARASDAQASTAALLTLIVVMLHVLNVVSRPHEWWKVLLMGASVVGYTVIFALPWTQSFFVLDISNLIATIIGLGMGLVGAGVIEAVWHLRSGRRKPA